MLEEGDNNMGQAIMFGQTSKRGYGINSDNTENIVSIDVQSGGDLPVSVVDEQIFLITNDFINKIYVTTNKPTSVAAGDVWVQIASGSEAVSVTDKSPYVRLGLVAAQQYDGAAWHGLKAYIGLEGEWKQFSHLFEDVAASDASTETIIKIEESGLTQEFIVLKHDYEGSGKTLVLRKELDLTKQKWNSSAIDILYAQSGVASVCNDYVTLRFSETVQSLMGETAVPCAAIGSDSTIAYENFKAFLLSAKEIGYTSTTYKTEGTAIPYFSNNTRRIVYLNGVATNWWTRTPHLDQYAVYANYSGAIVHISKANDFGVRPAFTLPGDMPIVQNPDGTYSIAECSSGIIGAVDNGGNLVGNANWNIFTQTDEPTATDGLWLKRDDIQKVELGELVYGDGTLTLKKGILPDTLNYGWIIPYQDKIYLSGPTTYGTALGAQFVYEYDPAEDVMVSKGALLTNQYRIEAAAEVDGVIYLFGGRSGSTTTVQNIIQAYDIENNIRTTKTAVVPNAKRGEGGAAAVNGLIYHFGGSNASTSTTVNIDKYDPVNDVMVNNYGALPNAAQYAACCVIGENIYVIAGGNPPNIYKYNPETNVVTTLLACTVETHGYLMNNCVAEIGGVIYVVSGDRSTVGITDQIRAFDPETNVYTTSVATIAGGTLRYALAAAHGGSVYIFGGTHSVQGNIRNIQEYKVATFDYDAGTAIVNLDAGSVNQVLLYQHDGLTFKSRIKDAVFQSEDGLKYIDVATNVDGAGWTTI